MKINGTTRVCAVIGCPVEHTLSPAIHNTLAKATGQNLVYTAFHVEPENVGAAILGAAALQIGGLNVTVPHKGAVIPYLKEIDPEAAMIGAVNTLVPTEGGYKGYNTDLIGLYRALTVEGIRIEGEDVILLGAGGAARAAAFLLALRGAKRVWMLNRSVDKALAVAAEVNTAVKREVILPMALSDWRQIPEGKYLTIQGTSVGLAPKEDAACIEDPEFYRMVHTGFDAIYRPADTKFMKLVRENGGKAYNGLKMLLYQGVAAYELWTGCQVTEEQAAECLAAMMEEIYG